MASCNYINSLYLSYYYNSDKDHDHPNIHRFLTVNGRQIKISFISESEASAHFFEQFLCVCPPFAGLEI